MATDPTITGDPRYRPVWAILWGMSAVMVAIMFFELDVNFIVRTVCICLLVLAFFTYCLYLVGDYLQAFWKWILNRSGQEGQNSCGPGLSDDQLSSQQKLFREKLQNEYVEKVAKHQVEVVIPREEAKKAELEREFYKFAGPAWKGKAQRLGDGQGDGGEQTNNSEKPVPRKRTQGTSKDAATARRLPESVTRPSPVVPDQPKPEKRVIVLPDEPEVGTKECITVAMRTLQNTLKKRRFLYTEKVQVLLDWMTKQGYHPKLYTVCTTFPRRDLSEHTDETLEDIRIVADTVVVIEER